MSGKSIWRKAGYRSRRQAMTEQFEFVDEETRSVRHLLAMIGRPEIVKNDGKRILIIGDSIAAIDCIALYLDRPAVVYSALYGLDRMAGR